MLLRLMFFLAAIFVIVTLTCGNRIDRAAPRQHQKQAAEVFRDGNQIVLSDSYKVSQPIDVIDTMFGEFVFPLRRYLSFQSLAWATAPFLPETCINHNLNELEKCISKTRTINEINKKMKIALGEDAFAKRAGATIRAYMKSPFGGKNIQGASIAVELDRAILISITGSGQALEENCADLLQGPPPFANPFHGMDLNQGMLQILVPDFKSSNSTGEDLWNKAVQACSNLDPKLPLLGPILRDFVQSVIDKTDTTGKPILVLGHSSGGALAMNSACEVETKRQVLGLGLGAFSAASRCKRAHQIVSAFDVPRRFGCIPSEGGVAIVMSPGGDEIGTWISEDEGEDPWHSKSRSCPHLETLIQAMISPSQRTLEEWRDISSRWGKIGDRPLCMQLAHGSASLMHLLTHSSTTVEESWGLGVKCVR